MRDKRSAGRSSRKEHILALVLLSLLLWLNPACQVTAQTAAIPATVDVSAMGSATYSIPVEVVPGTGGMQPNLAIVYNSLGGNGQLGTKWSLQGLSAITRTIPDRYLDGYMNPITFNASDRYTLDGKRLILLDGVNYHNGTALYCFENDDLSRIQLAYHGDGTGFECITADGSIIEYGCTANARLTVGNAVMSWMVNRVTDAEGNSMTFTYGQSNGEIWIERIDYTYNENALLLTPYASVEFSYGMLQHPGDMYVSGRTFRQSRLLKDIAVQYQGNQVRRYHLGYVQNGFTAHLDTVTLLNANDESLSTTRIIWESPSEFTSDADNSAVPGGYTAVAGNFNGDRLYDVFAVNRATSDPETFRLLIRKPDGSYQNMSSQYQWQYGTPDFESMTACDMDGDGIDEIVYRTTGIPTASCFALKLQVDGNTVSATQLLLASDLFPGQPLLGDFDGDGVAEAMIPVGVDRHFRQYGMEGMNVNDTVNLLLKADAMCAGDFTGDGKADLMLFKEQTGKVYSYNTQTCRWFNYGAFQLPDSCRQAMAADFNGDGLTDLLLWVKDNQDNLWVAAINQGQSQWTLNVMTDMDVAHWMCPLIGTESVPYPKHPALILDVNGDGRSDILQPVEDLTVKVYLSQGVYNNQFNTVASHFSHTDGQLFFTNMSNRVQSYFTVGDFDGNGIADLMFYNPNLGTQPSTVKYFYRNSLGGHYVERVTDAMRKVVKFDYSTLSMLQRRYVGTDMNRMPFPVVRNLLVSDCHGGFDTTSYYYGDVDYDLTRNAWLGFRRFGVFHDGMLTEHTFRRLPRTGGDAFPLLVPDSMTVYSMAPGTVPTAWTYSSGGMGWTTPVDIPVERTRTLSAALWRNSASGTVLFMPYSREQRQTDSLNNTLTVTTLTMDTTLWRVKSKDVKRMYATGSTAIVDEETVSYQYGNIMRPNGRSTQLPVRIVTRHWNSPDHTLYRETVRSLVYTQGRLSRETVADNGDHSVVTDYTYTVAGTPKRVTVTPDGAASRYTEHQYDGTYRFVIRSIDHAGNVTLATHDNATGKVLTTTDINGLVTRNHYDDWGRKVRIENPDGTVSETSYTFGGGGDFQQVSLLVTGTASGEPERRSYYDALGREIHTYEGGTGFSDAVYDRKGHLVRRTSIPYAYASASDGDKQWMVYSCDRFGRVVLDSSSHQRNSYSFHPLAYNGNSYQPYSSVTNNLGATSTTFYDAAGRVARVQDNGGTVDYLYDYTMQDGVLCDQTRITLGGHTTTIITDSRGNRLSLSDPDAGTTVSEYNAWDELVGQTDANGNQTAIGYDNQGRMVLRTYTAVGGGSESFGFEYNSSYTPNERGKGKLARVTRDGATYRVFGYDAYGRLSSESKTIDGATHTHQYTYNAEGQLLTRTFPDAFSLRYVYDSHGRLRIVKDDATGDAIYTVDSRTDIGQPKLCWYGNGTGVRYIYNTQGLPVTIKYGYRELEDPVIIFDPDLRTRLDDPGSVDIYTVGDQYATLTYGYNDKGYITSRGDLNTAQYESYTYDALGRLTQVSVDGVQNYYFGYDGSGNMTQNSRVSADYLGYDASQPHAVSSVRATEGSISPSRCEVSYNRRNRPASITEEDWKLNLSYGAGLQREKSVLTYEGNPVRTTLFISGDCEHEETPTFSRYIDYIKVGGQTVALHVYNETANGDSIYYVQTDLLGSWERVVDADKNVVQSSHFDPWGNRMSPTDWTSSQDGSGFRFHRGFTGHEHYDEFGIINMNARLYDPALGRFFSPDPQVQSPFSTQGFNRYSYCGNNPVMYSDPDGEFAWMIPVIISTSIGIYSGGVIANNGEYNPFKWDYSSGKTWGYMGAGGIVGFASGFLGWAITTAQIPMANTISLMASSFVNSVGTNLYTGGQTPISISFGFGSYDITNSVFHTFSKDNKWYENFAYSFGALAILPDIVSLVFGGGENIIINSEKTSKKGGKWGHSSITNTYGETIISVGPKGGYTAESKNLIDIWRDSQLPADISWDNYWSEAGTWSVNLPNISTNILYKYVSKVTRWNLLFNSCVGHTTRALWLAGVPTLYLLHPHMLNVQLFLRQLGIYSSPYVYQL